MHWPLEQLLLYQVCKYGYCSTNFQETQGTVLPIDYEYIYTLHGRVMPLDLCFF